MSKQIVGYADIYTVGIEPSYSPGGKSTTCFHYPELLAIQHTPYKLCDLFDELCKPHNFHAKVNTIPGTEYAMVMIRRPCGRNGVHYPVTLCLLIRGMCVELTSLVRIASGKHIILGSQFPPLHCAMNNIDKMEARNLRR